MGAEPSVPGAAGLSAECQSQTALVAISAVLEARNASEEWGAIHLRDAGDYREASPFVVRAQHIGQSHSHEPAERPYGRARKSSRRRRPVTQPQILIMFLAKAGCIMKSICVIWH